MNFNWYSFQPGTSNSVLVGLGRVELPTSRLSGVRSNHLSYRPWIAWIARLSEQAEWDLNPLRRPEATGIRGPVEPGEFQNRSYCLIDQVFLAT